MVRNKHRNLQTGESRTADTATVAWVMLSLTALLCELGVVALLIVQQTMAPAPRIELLATLLFFAALVAGVFGMVILPLVLRFRKVAPPRSIVVASIIIGLVPLVAIVALALHAR